MLPVLFVVCGILSNRFQQRTVLNYRNLIRFRTGLVCFMGGRFMVMNEREPAMAEAAVGGRPPVQNMEQFSGGNRTDAADFFESGPGKSPQRRPAISRK